MGQEPAAQRRLTWPFPVRLQRTRRPDVGVLHRLPQLLLLFALLLGNVLLLQLPVLQLVLQFHAARLQQAAERGTPLLGPRLGQGGGTYFSKASTQNTSTHQTKQRNQSRWGF